MKRLIVAIVLVAMLLTLGCSRRATLSIEPSQLATQPPIEIVPSETVQIGEPASTNQPEQAAETEPIPEPVPTEKPVALSEHPKVIHWHNPDWVEEAVVASVDLDYDGTEEQISFAAEDNPYSNSMLHVGDAEFLGDFMMPDDIYVCDLDLKDGTMDILFVGDVHSSDYVAYHLKYDRGSLLCKGEFYGTVSSINDDEVLYSMLYDCLGTWQVFIPYGMDENGTLQPQRDYYTCIEWDYLDVFSQKSDGYFTPYLVTTRELPVMVEGSTGYLVVGTKLLPTFFSFDGTVGFAATKDNGEIINGSFNVVNLNKINPDDWGFTIEGISEYEWFESLNYTG